MEILCLAGALVAALCALAFVERRRRVDARRFAAMRLATETLRDDVWELEAAAAGRDRAEAASEAKSRFLATVSHEIRTPLAGIVGAADLLAGCPLDGEASSYVGAIRTSGAALGSLIDEILDFSRIEAGRLELAETTFTLAPLVEGVVELLAPRAHDRGLDIACLVAPDAPRELRGDPGRLRQILLNLAGNALKFTHEGGVGLRIARDGVDVVRFTVSDTGPGVPPARRHAIFEEFEQGDHAATRAHGGAGLGLAISRALAHRMGGALTLDRSSSQGSSFSLALPCQAQAEPVAPETSCATRILLVGRTPFETPFLAERLAWLGASVSCVDGEDEARSALSSMTGAAFEIAILDCAIGEDVVRRLAGVAHDAGVGRAIVLLSPFERRALSPAAWREFDGWLVKPVRDASLRLCLEARTNVATAPHGPPSVRRLDGCHVLVAEDDDVNALIATRSLERQGARVTRVGDGAAALAALEGGGPFDVALMDIRMPVLDGLAAARAIRAHSSPTVHAMPLIALSANAFEDDRRFALAAGFDVFLVKPVGLDALADAVADRAGLRQARDAA